MTIKELTQLLKKYPQGYAVEVRNSQGYTQPATANDFVMVEWPGRKTLVIYGLSRAGS